MTMFSDFKPLQSPPRLAPAQPGRSALLLVHCQKWLTAPDGWLQVRATKAHVDLRAYRQAQVEVADTLGMLLTAARSVGLDVIHVAAGTQLPDGADAPVTFPIRVHVNEPQATFWPEASPMTGELVLAAASISPFSTTELERVLSCLGIEQLVIAGALVDGAVEWTACDARDRGYEVVVAQDACVAFNPVLHAGAMARLQHAHIAVLPTAVIAARLADAAPWPGPDEMSRTWNLSRSGEDPWPRLVPTRESSRLGTGGIALVTVDMQYLNAHPDHGSGREARELGLTTFDALFAAIEAFLPDLQAFQHAARTAGLRLVHLRTACQSPDARDSGRGRRPARRPMAALGTRETEFLAGCEPRPDELVVNKTSWGPFNSTPLAAWLARLGCSHLLVAGVVTNGCVEMTVRGALDRGFAVTVLSDITAARDPESHQDALARMTAAGARTAPSRPIRATLASNIVAAPAEFAPGGGGRH